MKNEDHPLASVSGLFADDPLWPEYLQAIKEVEAGGGILTRLKTWRQDLWDAGWRVGIVRIVGIKFLLWRK